MVCVYKGGTVIKRNFKRNIPARNNIISVFSPSFSVPMLMNLLSPTDSQHGLYHCIFQAIKGAVAAECCLCVPSYPQAHWSSRGGLGLPGVLHGLSGLYSLVWSGHA